MKALHEVYDTCNMQIMQSAATLCETQQVPSSNRQATTVMAIYQL